MRSIVHRDIPGVLVLQELLRRVSLLLLGWDVDGRRRRLLLEEILIRMRLV
jgi:hypothetical protein